MESVAVGASAGTASFASVAVVSTGFRTAARATMSARTLLDAKSTRSTMRSGAASALSRRDGPTAAFAAITTEATPCSSSAVRT
jgi:hypothetical protein